MDEHRENETDHQPGKDVNRHASTQATVKACANRPSVHPAACLPGVAIVGSRSDRMGSRVRIRTTLPFLTNREPVPHRGKLLFSNEQAPPCNRILSSPFARNRPVLTKIPTRTRSPSGPACALVIGSHPYSSDFDLYAARHGPLPTSRPDAEGCDTGPESLAPARNRTAGSGVETEQWLFSFRWTTLPSGRCSRRRSTQSLSRSFSYALRQGHVLPSTQSSESADGS